MPSARVGDLGHNFLFYPLCRLGFDWIWLKSAHMFFGALLGERRALGRGGNGFCRHGVDHLAPPFELGPVAGGNGESI